jgi:hypothetical protein
MKEQFGKFSKIAGFVTGMAMPNIAAAQPEAVSQETSYEVAESTDQASRPAERQSFTNAQEYAEYMRSNIDRYINHGERYVQNLFEDHAILSQQYQGAGFIEFRINEQGEATPTQMDGNINNESDGGRQLLNFLRTNVGISNLYLTQSNVNVDEVMGQRHLSSDYYGLEIRGIDHSATIFVEPGMARKRNLVAGAGFSEEEALKNALRNLVPMGTAYYSELPHEINSANFTDGERSGAYSITRSGLEMALVDVKIVRIEHDSQGVFTAFVSAEIGQLDLSPLADNVELFFAEGIDAADYQRRQVLRNQLVVNDNDQSFADSLAYVGSATDMGIDLINEYREKSGIPLTLLPTGANQRVDADIRRHMQLTELLGADGAAAYSGPRTGISVRGRGMNIRIGTDTTDDSSHQIRR